MPHYVSWSSLFAKLPVKWLKYVVDLLQSLKQVFINVSYPILVASLTLIVFICLTLMALNRAIRVRLATRI